MLLVVAVIANGRKKILKSGRIKSMNIIARETPQGYMLLIDHVFLNISKLNHYT
jgi:hypothetical protein